MYKNLVISLKQRLKLWEILRLYPHKPPLRYYLCLDLMLFTMTYFKCLPTSVNLSSVGPWSEWVIVKSTLNQCSQKHHLVSTCFSRFCCLCALLKCPFGQTATNRPAFTHLSGACLNRHLWVVWSAGEPGSCFRCPSGINCHRPWHFNEGQEEQGTQSWEHVVWLSHQATNKSLMFLRCQRHGYLLQAENTSANMSAYDSAVLLSRLRSFSCRSSFC